MNASGKARHALAVLVAALGLGALWAGGTISRAGRAAAGADADTAGDAARARVVAFWQTYREATERRLASRYPDAAAAYERALAFSPEHEDALYYLGHVRLELGEFAAAERAWRRLADIDPASARAHLQLGTLYLCFEDGAPTDIARAAAAFRRAHEINKEETGAVLRLGEIALVQGDAAAAAEQFSAVLGSNPGSVPAQFYLGYLAWQAGRGEEALGRFREAVARAQARPISAAPGEGDTKHGLDPLLATQRRCLHLEDPASDLDTVPESAVGRELDRRYGALRALVAEARRRGGIEEPEARLRRPTASSSAAPLVRATGALEGVVRLDGDSIPRPTSVANTTDPAVCGETQSLQDLLVADPGRGIAHVIVVVTDVPERRLPPPRPDTLVLDNRGCRFVPHAAAVTAGSTIHAANSDPLLHTTHFYGALRANISLPMEGLVVRRTARRSGMISVKCDVHGWMQAYIRVGPHGLHAVTDSSGWYRIVGIPAGTYPIEFWHERLGVQVRDVTIAAGGTARLDAAYRLERPNPSGKGEPR